MMLPHDQQQSCQPTAPPSNYYTLPPDELPTSQPPPPLPQQQQQQQQQQQHQQQQQQQQQPGMLPAAGYPASFPTFRRISVRNIYFQLGFGGLFLSACLFIIGYSAPAWIEGRSKKSGLWMACYGSGCQSNVGGGPDWFDAVRTMETLALVCFLAAMAVALYDEVFKSPPPADSKVLEILAALASIFGLIGVAIYGAKYPRWGVWYYYSHYYGRFHLSWGYALTTAGAILVLICAGLIAYSRAEHAAQTQQAQAQAGIPLPPASQPSALPMYTLPMQCGPPPPMGYPPAPYPYPYPYPYPPMTSLPVSAPPPTHVAAPPAAAAVAPTSPHHSSTSPHASASMSQGPVFFVMSQGRALPVYDTLPTTATETALTPAP